MEEVITRQKAIMSEEEFLEFIQTEIEKYKKHSSFEAKSDISFSDLQEKLIEYTPLSLTLTQLQARYRYRARILKRVFDQWFDNKVIEVQKAHNRLDIAKTKWLSSTELERFVRVENSEEYQKRIEECDSMEAREKFISSLIKNWEGHNYILSQMSSNIRAEANIGSIESRLTH